MLKIFVITLAIFIQGCATKSLNPEPISADKLDQTTGIIVGSFARNPEGREYHTQTFRFRNTDTGKEYALVAKPRFDPVFGTTKDDFETEESDGTLFSFILPAGNYTFYNFWLYQANGYSWKAKKSYSIPFEVAGNEVKYLGEIKLNNVTGKNIFGMSVNAGGVWTITNQWDRDFPLMKKKYPKLPIHQLVVSIPDYKETPTSLVILPSDHIKFVKPE